ncbi:ena/VASP-like protein [Eriocheir sinensis]|uniref:ena/VASP-like protein n=1 Tax=Eriocheir sinensis TaxID=95602 RepID=UPI0021C5DFBB|nr:ena/VASP-like protein [Eriocheir sinensis]
MLPLASPKSRDPDDDKTGLHPPHPTPSPADTPQCDGGAPPLPPPQPAVPANTLPRPAARRRSSGGRHSLCAAPEAADRWVGGAGGAARPRDLWGAAPRPLRQDPWQPSGHPDAGDGPERGDGPPRGVPGLEGDVGGAWGGGEPDVDRRSDERLLAATPDSLPTGLDNPALEHTEEAVPTPNHTPHTPAATSHPARSRERLASPWPSAIFSRSPRSSCTDGHPLLGTPEMWAPLASQESMGVLLSGVTPASPPARSLSSRSFAAPRKSWSSMGHAALSSLRLTPRQGIPRAPRGTPHACV